jgi:2-dehydro-3-deoxyglucarate aldolase/4-hydroxy-2-oxoheptanedioate aldolase
MEGVMDKKFRSKLRKKDVLLGTVLGIASPEVAEIISEVGFDWVWIDMEHATIDLVQAQIMTQALREGCASVVRVPWNDSVWIKKTLDIGCDGIIIPRINTAEEAKAAVRACKYPSEGIRSVGVSRASKYGMEFKDYVRNANEEIAIILQIEHIEGVNNVETIVDIPGIDAIMIGPYDLSGSLNLIGQLEKPEVKNSIKKVKQCCHEKGTTVGIFADGPETASTHMSDGVTLIGMGSDSVYLWRSAKQELKQLSKPTR